MHNQSITAMPDRLLRAARALPMPIGERILNRLHRMFRARGYATGELTNIRFGKYKITAPLDHPSVYWRYWPVGFNQNYVIVVREVERRRTGLIIDVGANIGDGVALLRGSGIMAPILAVEGADVWFALLQSNTRQFSDVELEQVFLGTGIDEGDLELKVQDGSSKLVRGESGVRTTSLDTLMLQYKKQRISVLKTDTDGFDAKVLLGAKSLLMEQRPVLFVEVDEGLLRDQGNSSQELLNYFSECGYSEIAVWDNFGRWQDARPISQGLNDLVARHPGGPNTPYLDIAVFSGSDRESLNAVRERFAQ